MVPQGLLAVSLFSGSAHSVSEYLGPYTDMPHWRSIDSFNVDVATSEFFQGAANEEEARHHDDH